MQLYKGLKHVNFLHLVTPPNCLIYSFSHNHHERCGNLELIEYSCYLIHHSKNDCLRTTKSTKKSMNETFQPHKEKPDFLVEYYISDQLKLLT